MVSATEGSSMDVEDGTRARICAHAKVRELLRYRSKGRKI